MDWLGVDWMLYTLMWPAHLTQHESAIMIFGIYQS